MPRLSSTGARVDLPPIEAYWRVACYEAFIHIVDSMISQHAKWLEWVIGGHWAPRQRPNLAEVDFCGVRGLALLAAARDTASLGKSGILAMAHRPGWQPNRDREPGRPARSQTTGSRCCTARSVRSHRGGPRARTRGVVVS